MLYEPTNVIPSVMTQTGTVSELDAFTVQWQVNGDSALTKYQIDIMQNNANSTFLYSTGVLSSNNTGNPAYNLPFYGKDRFGDYVPFVFKSNGSWGGLNSAIQDGESFKYSIIQFYQEPNNTVKIALTSNLLQGETAYFSYNLNGSTVYVSVTVADTTLFVSGTDIYYSFTHNSGWLSVANGSRDRVVPGITFSYSTSAPTGNTKNLGTATAIAQSDTFYNQFFTAQSAFSVVNLRTAPTLSINTYATPVATATMTFTATYNQAQGDAIQSVRWQLFSLQNGIQTLIDDTGIIYTQVLEYEYNGLFNNFSYNVVCTVVTVSGVEVTANSEFNVSYVSGEYSGEFTVAPVCEENANLLSWTPLSVIPGHATPDEKSYILHGSSSLVYLQSGAVITWDEQINSDGESTALDFSAPWTVACCGEYKQPIKISRMSPVSDAMGAGTDFPFRGLARYNATNNLAVFAVNAPDDFGANYSLAYYNVNGTALTLSGKIDSDNIIFQTITDMQFSADNQMFVVCGELYDSSYYSFALFQVIEGGGFQQLVYPEALENSRFGTINTIDIYYHSQDDSYYIIVGGELLGDESSGFQLYRWSKGEHNIFYVADLKTDNSPVPIVIKAVLKNNSPNEPPLLVYTTEDNSVYAVSLQDIDESSQYYNMSIIGNETTNALCIGLIFTPSQNYIIALQENGYYFVFSVGTQSFGIVADSLYLEEVGDYSMLSSFTSSGNYFITPYSIFSVTNEWQFNLLGSYASYNQELADWGIGEFWTILPIGTDNFVLASETAIPINEEEGEASSYAFVWQTQAGYSGKLAEITQSDNSTYSIWQQQGYLTLMSADNTQIAKVAINGQYEGEGSSFITVVVAPDRFICQYGTMTETAWSGQQQTISSISIYGEQTFDFMSVIDGDGTSYINELALATEIVRPSWNATNYSVELLADFNKDIDGGTGTSTGNGFRVYRSLTENPTELFEIATTPSTVEKLKDYSIVTNESYTYSLYVYDAYNAFMGVVTAAPKPQRFNKYSLLVTNYNSSDNCYHVSKEYLFSCNLTDEALSNNSNKSYVQNFTPYPAVFKSSANYASGTLQALIGFVDKKTYRYWDDTALMKELNDLSTTDSTLFLRDLKGHLWMIDVGTVQQTVKYGTREMQVTISLPWTEIGDASEVSIIQTPNDDGWDWDAQVLDVRLDVDPETGLLQVVYPFPYNGTAFYLVGVTPNGVVSAVQPLSDTASQPTDGQLKALVRHK